MMPKIAIFGLAKTGTTALYYQIKQVMPHDTACYFEPGRKDMYRLQRRQLLERLPFGNPRAILAKFILAHPSSDVFLPKFGGFDKSILITRDPRDRLVSGLLYRSYESPIAKDDAALKQWLLLLQKKEADPASISIVELLDAFRTLHGPSFALPASQAAYVETGPSAAMAFADRNPDMFVFRYEDLVDKRFAELSAYLGYALQGEASVASQVNRVVRTKGYGNWRHWFTSEDVAALGPALQPYLDRYYAESDWQLATRPEIEPQHASAYVARIVNERRQMDGLSALDLLSDRDV